MEEVKRNNGYGYGENKIAKSSVVNGYVMAVDSLNNLYAAFNQHIKQIDFATTILNSINNSTNRWGGNSPILASCKFTIDKTGENAYYIGNGSGTVGLGACYKYNFASQVETKIAGFTNFATTPTANGDGGKALKAAIFAQSYLSTVKLDKYGNIYIPESNSIRKVNASDTIISTIAGNSTIKTYSGDGGNATKAGFNSIESIEFDKLGNLFIVDRGNNRIRKVNMSIGIISTYAGNGNAGFSGDGGISTSASLNHPTSIYFDGANNAYISDYDNNRIRKIDAATGIITTIAGNGQACLGGDGGNPLLSSLNGPMQVLTNNLGDIFIADLNNIRIRKISGIAVPLHLLSLTAHGADNNNVVLQWQTTNEVNTASFFIERSTSNGSFTAIGSLNAVGSGASSYQFSDIAPQVGTNFYRLKMIDKDGKFSYSQVVSASVSNAANNNNIQIINLAPNPAVNSTTIYFKQGVSVANIAVYNALGVKVLAQEFGGAVRNSFVLPTASLQAGTYIVNVKTALGTYSSKLQIVR